MTLAPHHLTTPQGTPYLLAAKPDGSTLVGLANGRAAKRVKRDASPSTPDGPLRWRSLDGQTFDSLEEVADSMRWAL